MKEDFSELIQYLDEKFAGIDAKLDNLQENKADKADVDAFYSCRCLRQES